MVQAWIDKASSDLETAEILIEGFRQRLDTGVYLCQQAAEKMLKALLTATDIAFPEIEHARRFVRLIQCQFGEDPLRNSWVEG